MKVRKLRQSEQGRFGRLLVNILGILCAFAIAFSGLFLVRDRLIVEQGKLLAGGGLVDLPQVETAEAVKAGDTFELKQLTEEELLQLVHSLEQKGEISPHEPLQGQLTMIQAMDCSEVWLEEFFLPHFGLSDLLSKEYGISCYLWTPETAGQEPDAVPWLSCWAVSISNQDIDVSLTLSAVSGQVLDASVSCSAPVPYQDTDSLMTLLDDYAFSFNLEEDYTLIYSEETVTGERLPWYQSIGTKGIYAAIQADNIVVANAVDSDNNSYYEEIFNVHLYLCSRVSPVPDGYSRGVFD